MTKGRRAALAVNYDLLVSPVMALGAALNGRAWGMYFPQVIVVPQHPGHALGQGGRPQCLVGG